MESRKGKARTLKLVPRKSYIEARMEAELQHALKHDIDSEDETMELQEPPPKLYRTGQVMWAG